MNSSIQILGSTTTFNFHIEYANKFLGLPYLEEILILYFDTHLRRITVEHMRHHNMDLQSRGTRHAVHQSIIQIFKNILGIGWAEADRTHVFDTPGDLIIVEIRWKPKEDLYL